MVTINAHEVGFLAGLLAYPGKDSLEVLEGLSPSAGWLQEALSELRGLSLDAWQGEHTRLFINGIPETVCPPFESAWRSDQMRGEMSAQVGEIYRQAGLSPERDMDMPDYLGTLLEGAAYLATTKDIAEEKRSRLLEELWDNHIASWVPEFAVILIRESQVKLYRVLGKRLQALFAQGSG